MECKKPFPVWLTSENEELDDRPINASAPVELHNIRWSYALHELRGALCVGFTELRPGRTPAGAEVYTSSQDSDRCWVN